MTNDIPYKRCIGPCGQVYPATTEFWHCGNGRYGLVQQCKVCMNAKKRAYYSQPEVKERVQEYNKKYNERPEVQERHRVQWKAYVSQSGMREHLSSYHKDYHSQPEVKEHTKKRMQAYYSQPEVKEQYAARAHNYRSRKRSVLGTYTPEQIQDQLKRQKHKCYYCKTRFKKTKGRYQYHIEHTFPLSRVAGSDIPANSIDYLVLSCQACNLSKHNKYPWEWPEGGRLL